MTDDRSAADDAWVRTTVGALGKLHCGQSPPSATVNTSGEGTPYVSGPEQWDGATVHQGKWTTSATRIAPANSVFITVKGAGVGTLFPGVDAAIGRDIYAFEPHDRIDFRFMYRALQYSIQDVIFKAQGDIPGLSKNHILDHEIAVPGPATQKRVASKVDELFSRIDEGERALERVATLVERYRQSVLKAAVTGELTRDWREKNKDQLESGEALLARILTARREAWEKAELDKMKAKGIAPANDKWTQKYEEPSAPGADDLPPLPENWTYVSVEQLCFVDTGATPKRGEARYFKDGTIDWVTSTAVNEAVILEAQERITQAAINETNAKVFPAGSFIVAMYGEGKTRGRIAELGIAAATNQACAALICGHLDPLVKAYVRTFFEKNYAALRASAAGGVQPNLNLGILKKTSLPLPPLAEMEVINDVSAAGLSQASAIAAEFVSWERRSTALRQKILAAAFAGELVSQESGDEPASELLERIAAGRTDAPAMPKRGRKPKTSEPA